MKLLEYMREEKLDDAVFAERINEGLPSAMHCTAYAVKKWKYGERRPDADRMIRIEEISGGKVSLRDWASDAVAAEEAAPSIP
jgi:hypothetical protein